MIAYPPDRPFVGRSVGGTYDDAAAAAAAVEECDGPETEGLSGAF
jgi:hypothetical protein